MLLGKRNRPPMKRTTSLSEITFDIGETQQQSDNHHHQINTFNGSTRQKEVGFGGGGLDHRFLSMISNTHRRHSGDFANASHFLRACCLCKRRLVPGRDIYMYRGDSAFCSLECRQHQMNQDERKEKCAFASATKQAASSATGSPVSSKGETVAAV